MIDALAHLSPLWLVAVIVWAAVVAGAVVGWLLRGSEQSARGGTLDLTPAAARGELDLDWSDPRHDVDVCRARGTFEESILPAILDRDALTARLAAIGSTPERPRLGLVSNVVTLDEHRGSRRA